MNSVEEWISVTNDNGDRAAYSLKHVIGIREYTEDRRKSILDFADGTWMLVKESLDELIEYQEHAENKAPQSWINHIHSGMCECPSCGEMLETERAFRAKYCPNCGVHLGMPRY